LRVLLEVRWLEVVGPQYPEVVFDQFGAFFLDVDGPGAEFGVGVLLVLLADRLDRLGLDPGLCRVVDATRKVAVRERGGLWREAACEEPHGVLLSAVGSRVRSTDHGISQYSVPRPSWRPPPALSRGGRRDATLVWRKMIMRVWYFFAHKPRDHR